MTVYFIGAGPGAPDLITVRGLAIVQRAPVILYAGSLVPSAILGSAKPDAHVRDTASMTLDEIIAEIEAAHAAGHDVARLHSGDPSIYGAIGEQMRRLQALAIAFEIVPGVPSFAAAAAALQRELTLPGLTQTVILTRTGVRASPMPEAESLEVLARTQATLAIHLSINDLAGIVRKLAPIYGADCPAVVAYRVSWPDQRIIRADLGTIRAATKAAKITRTALILVGRALGSEDFRASSLYDPAHSHILRLRKAKKIRSR
jgi:precorrin-4/cobalt-precorrin-4 C11-methyltransferase